MMVVVVVGLLFLSALGFAAWVFTRPVPPPDHDPQTYEEASDFMERVLEYLCERQWSSDAINLVLERLRDIDDASTAARTRLPN